MNTHPYFFDLVSHIRRQRDFSLRTFGPGKRTSGVLDHIRKELLEIAANPTDITEWVDVILLALDGAWRSNHSPEDIAVAIQAKQARNELREWPDWRASDPARNSGHILRRTEMLFTKEHQDLMASFERDTRGRLDKEDKNLWPRGNIYRDGHVNEAFKAYRNGYSFGKAVALADLREGNGRIKQQGEQND